MVLVYMCSGGLYGAYTYIRVDMCTNVPREARGGCSVSSDIPICHIETEPLT